MPSVMFAALQRAEQGIREGIAEDVYEAALVLRKEFVSCPALSQVLLPITSWFVKNRSYPDTSAEIAFEVALKSEKDEAAALGIWEKAITSSTINYPVTGLTIIEKQLGDIPPAKESLRNMVQATFETLQQVAHDNAIANFVKAVGEIDATLLPKAEGLK